MVLKLELGHEDDDGLCESKVCPCFILPESNEMQDLLPLFISIERTL